MAFDRHDRAYKKKHKIKDDLPQRKPQGYNEEAMFYFASGGDPKRCEYIKKHWPKSEVILWYWISKL